MAWSIGPTSSCLRPFAMVGAPNTINRPRMIFSPRFRSIIPTRRPIPNTATAMMPIAVAIEPVARVASHWIEVSNAESLAIMKLAAQDVTLIRIGRYCGTVLVR